METCEAYLERHELVDFLQDALDSLLESRPTNPYRSAAAHAWPRMARGAHGPLRPVAPSPHRNKCGAG